MSTAEPNLTLIVDRREQAPLVFTRFQSTGVTLQSRDYSFQGGVELFSAAAEGRARQW